MEKNKISSIKQQYDNIVHNMEQSDVEFWYARDLMPLLGYERWENFDKAIVRAMVSCKTAGIATETIFVRSRKWSRSAVKPNGRLKIIC